MSLVDFTVVTDADDERVDYLDGLALSESQRDRAEGEGFLGGKDLGEARRLNKVAKEGLERAMMGR
ncbi:MAG: hypothetical protein O8C66_04840 [Candidatus Methanoperedens sp.]|nr:hypothetical protein [Candidatus Methanoperedens sp.]MCZ7369815.1 hypothetical protein [Candidatus Methanoperedens sp.]